MYPPLVPLLSAGHRVVETDPVHTGRGGGNTNYKRIQAFTHQLPSPERSKVFLKVLEIILARNTNLKPTPCER